MKLTWTRALMACCATALSLACGGEKPAPAATAAPATAAPANSMSAPAATATTAAAVPVGGSIGVPECDEYMSKYEACINQHVPAAQKPAMQQAFDAARSNWRVAATNAESRPSLANACKQAMDAAKAATGFYGCQW